MLWKMSAVMKSNATKRIKVQHAVLMAIFRGIDLSLKCCRYSPYTMRNAMAEAMGAKVSVAQKKMRIVMTQ